LRILRRLATKLTLAPLASEEILRQIEGAFTGPYNVFDMDCGISFAFAFPLLQNIGEYNLSHWEEFRNLHCMDHL